MPNNERITPVAPDVRPMPETATIDGQPAWLARHVGVALGYQSPDHVGQAAKAGRDDFDPATHVVYDSGEVYLTASGVRHACARRRRGKREAARLLEHIETETAPKREWSTAAFPGEAAPSKPWPVWPPAHVYYQHREAEKAKREKAARLAAVGSRYDFTPLMVAGVVMLGLGVFMAPESIPFGGVCSAVGAFALVASGWLWGSR